MASNITIAKQCILRSRNHKYRDVTLPDKTCIIVGRGPRTKIRDRHCSKSQSKNFLVNKYVFKGNESFYILWQL